MSNNKESRIRVSLPDGSSKLVPFSEYLKLDNYQNLIADNDGEFIDDPFHDSALSKRNHNRGNDDLDLPEYLEED